MIKVTVKIFKLTGKISSIEVYGHSNSAEEGKDLVCAGVSAVITGGMNALEDVKNYIFIQKKGEMLIESKNEVSEHDNIVLKTIITGLKTIEETNKAFIQIEEIYKD